MFSDIAIAVRLWLRLGQYRPQPVTISRAWVWLRQFRGLDKSIVKRAAAHLTFVSEKKLIRDVMRENKRLLDELKNAGVGPKQIVYVSVHDAGSSSAALLKFLRDDARLESLGCNFVDSRDAERLQETTRRIGRGAIIYVDDFAGTGRQFCEMRSFTGRNILGAFSEFALFHTVCEEAISEISKRTGADLRNAHVHPRSARPLHPSSDLFSAEHRGALAKLCYQINPKQALGYGRLASMVVFCWNTPNNAPAVFRGSTKQAPFVGLVPRTTDLPPLE